MDLSIIIPSFNTKNLLDRCLKSIEQSLQSSNLQYEIIVVDNASKDDTRVLLKRKYPRVKLIFNNINLGFSKSNNQAILKSIGTYILLLNSDTVVLKDAINQLFNYCKNHPKSFIGGKLLNEDISPQPSCGPFYTLPIVALVLFFRGDYWGVTRYSPNKIRKVDWVSGACLIGTKTSFLDVGLFDEHIFMYIDEIEFLYRAKQLGFKTWFYPHTQFVHTGAASSADRKTPVLNIYRGLTYFYQKHCSHLEYIFLVNMLKVKALFAIQMGRMIHRQDLVLTYEEALSILTK